jgi:putative phosphoesterase
MHLALLSDTHGNVARTVRAIAALKAHRPGHVIHCGDIGSAAVLTELAAGFADPETPVTCVLGNVDTYADDLFSPVAYLDIAGRLATLTLAGKSIAVIHGDDTRRLDGLIANQTFDYIFTGHTHAAADDQRGRTRIINPGALHRAHQPSCAILDLATNRLTFLPIP